MTLTYVHIKCTKWQLHHKTSSDFCTSQYMLQWTMLAAH